MKPRTPTTEARRYAQAQSVAWLLTIFGPAGPWRAATRPIELGEEVYPARLAAPPEVEMGPVPGAGDPGGLALTQARVRVADVAGGADSLRSLLAVAPPGTLRARGALLWTEPGEPPAAEEAITFIEGVVVDWAAEPTGLLLTLRDALGAVVARPALRALTPGMTGGEPSPLLGEPLPLVFGRVDDAEALLLRGGQATRLARPLGPNDPVAQVASIDGFPSAGLAQIGEELIGYAAIDPEARTLGLPERPLAREPSPRLYSPGETVRLVPDGGFQWLVADHACAAVIELRADGVSLSPATPWTAELRPLGAYAAHVVTLPRWPVLRRYAGRSRLQTLGEILGPGAYAVLETSTALNPEFALDGRATSTAARLAAAASLLAVGVNPALAEAGTHLGRWIGGRVRLRYSASGRWGPTTQAWLRFVHGEVAFQSLLPRPIDVETTGRVVAPPGELGAPVETSLAIHEFALDLGPTIPEALGWAAFAESEAPRIEVELSADGDATEFLIHELDLTVEFFPVSAIEPARRLSATVEGWPDEAGEPLLNPADLLALLLTHERFGALEATAPVADELETLRQAWAGVGYGFARRVPAQTTLGDLLGSAAREAGVWVRSTGARVSFERVGLVPSVAGAVETLGAAKALWPPAVLRTASRSALTERGLALVVSRPGGAAVWRSRSSQDLIERPPARERLLWLDGREEGALADLGARWWSLRAEPLLEIEQEYPPGAALLEPGDSVLVDEAALGLLALPAWVEAVGHLESGRARLKLLAPEAGEVCWQASALDFLRVFGFGARTVLYVAGVPMLWLEAGGNLRLRGEVRESAPIAAGPFAGPVALDGGDAYFSVGAGATWTPFLRLTQGGDADLTGTIREGSLLAFLIDGQCLSADGERLRLSPRPSEAALEFVAAEGVLHLRGEIIERSLLF